MMTFMMVILKYFSYDSGGQQSTNPVTLLPVVTSIHFWHNSDGQQQADDQHGKEKLFEVHFLFCGNGVNLLKEKKILSCYYI